MGVKIVLDEVCDEGLKHYLLSQNGILNVTIVVKDFLSEVNIEYEKGITAFIISKYLHLYLNNKHPILVSFNRKVENQFKTLKYLIKDMCCEYCYKSLVEALFNNPSVVSVNSNFKFDAPAFDIEFAIGYDEKLNEKEIIKIIQDNA